MIGLILAMFQPISYSRCNKTRPSCTLLLRPVRQANQDPDSLIRKKKVSLQSYVNKELGFKLLVLPEERLRMSVPAELILGAAVAVNVVKLLSVDVEGDVEKVGVGIRQRGANDDELAVVDGLQS